MSGSGEPAGVVGRERWAWVALLAVAAWARLHDLGVRTMTHDESLHAYFSFRLFTEGVYQHDPVYHGPFLYHLNALVYFLFGASDVTARLAPTLMGVALVGGLWWWRGYLGRRGAWLAAAFVTISPTLLFYSRHIRNDIYIACFTLAWAYAVLRYLDDRRDRWLRLLVMAMAVSFITKEVSFITGAVMGSFVALVAAFPSAGVASASRRAAATDLAILMLALVLPFASGAIFIALGWSPVGEGAQALVFGRGSLVLAMLFAAAAAAGAWRFGARRWLTLAGLFWAVQVTWFTTFYTNITGGLTSGIVGSLGYWLTQQEVARAGQPWFYYGLLGLLYEFLPLTIGGAALAAGLWRMRDRAWDPVDATDRLTPDAPDADDASGRTHRREQRRLWLGFAAWWIVASWVGYAVAGEKMPWLFVHQVLPLCLVAGWGVQRLIGVDWRADARVEKVVLVAATAFALVVVVGLFRSHPFAGRDIGATAETAAWWTRVLWLMALAGVMSITLTRVGWRTGRRMLALGVIVPGVVLTARASLQVNFVNVDAATELMSYAQASPDVRRVLGEIERLDERSGGHRQLRVAVDDENSWPFSWYLRDYRNTVAWGSTPELASSAEVILVGPKNRAALAPHVSRGYVRQRGILYWWPLQGYASLTPSSLWTTMADAEQREYLWQVVMHRRYGVQPREWPARRDFDVYIREDAAALVGMGRVGGARAGGPTTAPLDAQPWTPRSVLQGPFDGLGLRSPAAVAVTADGTWLIADTGNHRIAAIDRDGNLRFTIGRGRCALEEPGQPGCVDPDGAGPRARGDGQFNEPWGVAVAAAGEIVVADTWNGRIQVFDARGTFLRAWGRFGRVEPAGAETQPDVLFGPRGLAITSRGELVVADTGNKRLVVSTITGERQRVVGPQVDIPPPLDEPTGVAWDANDTLLVADLWNQRLLRLDRAMRPLASWPVPGWDSRAAEDKAGVAVDANGRVYASDPETGHILVFTASGAIEARLALPPNGEAPAKPTGLAVDTDGRTLLVTDRTGHRLLVLSGLPPPS